MVSRANARAPSPVKSCIRPGYTNVISIEHLWTILYPTVPLPSAPAPDQGWSCSPRPHPPYTNSWIHPSSITLPNSTTTCKSHNILFHSSLSVIHLFIIFSAPCVHRRRRYTIYIIIIRFIIIIIIIMHH